MGPLDMFDDLAFVGIDTSVGLGQIKMNTAMLIEERSQKRNNKIAIKTSDKERARALNNPKENIRYLAAYIKKIQDVRKSKFPEITSRPDIVYTIYNKGLVHTDPKPNPESNDRGKEIEKLYPQMSRLV